VVAHSLCNLVACHSSISLESPLAARATRHLLHTSHVGVEQPPSYLEKPVDLLSAPGFRVVPGKSDDIQLAEKHRLEHADQHLVPNLFVMRLSIGHSSFTSHRTRSHRKSMRYSRKSLPSYPRTLGTPERRREQPPRRCLQLRYAPCSARHLCIVLVLFTHAKTTASMPCVYDICRTGL